MLDREAKGTVDLLLSPLLPLDFTVQTIHGDLSLDLSELNMNSLTAFGGSGSTNIVLPQTGSMNMEVSGGLGGIAIRPPNSEADVVLRSLQIHGGVGTIRLELPLGDADVKIFAGVGDITIIVPEGLGVELSAPSEGSAVSMFNDRFEEVRPGVWRTTDYDDLPNHTMIEIEAGLGSITITD